MDDKQAALLWQMMQSLSDAPSENAETSWAAPPNHPWEMLQALRPMLSPKQQRFFDLVAKIQEVKALMAEIQDMP